MQPEDVHDGKHGQVGQIAQETEGVLTHSPHLLVVLREHAGSDCTLGIKFHWTMGTVSACPAGGYLYLLTIPVIVELRLQVRREGNCWDAVRHDKRGL